MPEVSGAFGLREAGAAWADGVPGGCKRARGGFAHHCLELGEDLLDGVEVRAVERQERKQGGPSPLARSGRGPFAPGPPPYAVYQRTPNASGIGQGFCRTTGPSNGPVTSLGGQFSAAFIIIVAGCSYRPEQPSHNRLQCGRRRPGAAHQSRPSAGQGEDLLRQKVQQSAPASLIESVVEKQRNDDAVASVLQSDPASFDLIACRIGFD